jgi:DNA replication protein DnaC
VRFYSLPRLIDGLAAVHALHNHSSFLRQVAKVDVLLLDDLALAPLTEQTKGDLLEILDDYDRRSTIVTSHLPVDQWHAFLADPTPADAILDRLVHNSYRLALKGDLMRKRATVDELRCLVFLPLRLSGWRRINH